MSVVFVEPTGWNNPRKDITKIIYQCNCCTYYSYNEDEMKDHSRCYTTESPEGIKSAI